LHYDLCNIRWFYHDFVKGPEAEYPYRRRAARPAAAMKPGIAVCMAAPPLDEVVDAPPPCVEDAPERAVLALLSRLEISELRDETAEETLERIPEAPEPTALVTEVKSVETSDVKVEPSETIVEAMVEMAETPTLTPEVEKIVVLPTVVSPVLLPLVMVETKADVVIATTPEVEKIVVLPMVVSPVLLPSVTVETRADVVIGLTPGVPRIVVLPTVVSLVLLPLTTVETRAEVVIGTSTPVAEPEAAEDAAAVAEDTVADPLAAPVADPEAGPDPETTAAAQKPLIQVGPAGLSLAVPTAWHNSLLQSRTPKANLLSVLLQRHATSEAPVQPSSVA